MKKIAIIGSYNQDLVFRAHRIPSEGETVQGIGFFSNSGGKGSNQMISAHLQGADITPVLKLGNDPYGQQARALYKRLGMPLAGLLQDPNEPTGMAGIFTGENGSNSIVVTGGANLTLTADEMVDAVPQDTALIGFQLENNPQAVFEAIRRLHRQGAKILLDPTPVTELPDWLYPCLDYLKPNEHEAAQLAGYPINNPQDALAAARILQGKGAKTVIVTLGVLGSVLCTEEAVFIPAAKADAVDTTAAGDIFCGALLAQLAADQPLIQAVQYATCASALSVTKQGAWKSCPTAKQTQEFFADRQEMLKPVPLQ